MNVWSKEWWRLLGTLAAALIVGLLLGFPVTVLFAGLALLIAWHVNNMWRLHRWLHSGAKITSIPSLSGAWDQIALYVYQIRKASRERKQRLTALISRFNSVASALPDAVVVLREHHEIDWINRAAQSLLGIYPRDVGQPIDNLLRDPSFKEYIVAHDFEQELELPSPARPDVLLGIRIVPFGDDFYVFRVVDSKAQRVPVKLGIRRNAQVELLSGAAAGDQIVVSGQLRLSGDGIAVRVVSAAPGSGEPPAANTKDTGAGGAEKGAAPPSKG